MPFLVVAGLFFLPVLDEGIAIPQLIWHCHGAAKYHYDPKTAFGQTVYAGGGSTEYKKAISGITFVIKRYSYVTAEGKPVVTSFEVFPQGGVLGFPDAGGSKNAWLLPACKFSRNDRAVAARRKLLFQDLQMKFVERR